MKHPGDLTSILGDAVQAVSTYSIVSLVVLVVHASLVRGQEHQEEVQSTTDDEVIAAFVSDGMKSNRELLRSGEVLISGKTSRLASNAAHRTPSSPDQLSGEARPNHGRPHSDFEVYCAFDFDRDLLRFDRSQRGIEGRYIRTSSLGILQVLQNDGKSSTITKISRDQSPSRAIHPFDFRYLGIYSNGDLKVGRPIDNEYYGLPSHLKVKGASSAGDNVYELTYLAGKGNIEYRLRVDGSRGMAPIHMEQVFVGDDVVTMFSADAEWTQIDGVFVPATCVMRDLRRRDSLRLVLTWNNINRPLEHSQFSIDSFSPRTGTYIVDRRLGKPIIESIVGREKAIFDNLQPRSRTRAIMVILNVVAVLAILFVLLYRKYRHRSFMIAGD